MFRLLVRVIQNIVRTLNGGADITDEQLSASMTQSKQASFFTEEEHTKDGQVVADHVEIPATSADN